MKQLTYTISEIKEFCSIFYLGGGGLSPMGFIVS